MAGLIRQSAADAPACPVPAPGGGQGVAEQSGGHTPAELQGTEAKLGMGAEQHHVARSTGSGDHVAGPLTDQSVRQKGAVVTGFVTSSPQHFLPRREGPAAACHPGHAPATVAGRQKTRSVVVHHGKAVRQAGAQPVSRALEFRLNHADTRRIEAPQTLFAGVGDRQIEQLKPPLFSVILGESAGPAGRQVRASTGTDVTATRLHPGPDGLRAAPPQGLQQPSHAIQATARHDQHIEGRQPPAADLPGREWNRHTAPVRDQRRVVVRGSARGIERHPQTRQDALQLGLDLSPPAGGLCGTCCHRDLGSIRSRSRLPSKLKHSTATAISNPGYRASTGLVQK